jgi:hypothetical protein
LFSVFVFFIFAFWPNAKLWLEAILK